MRVCDLSNKEEVIKIMKTDMYYEPEKILDSFQHQKSEMNHEQLAFLCGLIKEKRPKKIVEVGVAAGGTTCVILECVKELELESLIYSIDLCNNYWQEPSKKTGYMLDMLPDSLKRKHRLITDKYLAECLCEISPERDIDFLILDTVHQLPGEIFDFIAAFPYLKKDAIVVLHDIVLNHMGGKPFRFATKLILDVVTANKYYLFDTTSPQCCKMGMENIAAFQINEDTGKYIKDCFSALTITWHYIPEERVLEIYRKFVSEEYDEECLKLWDCSIKMQQLSDITRYIEKDIGGVSNYKELIRKWRNSAKVCIYGFGTKGQKYLNFACLERLRVDAIVVSDTQSVCVEGIVKSEIPIYHISSLPFSKDECSFLNAGERESSIKEINNNIRFAGYYKILNG